jgi:hypothetical protein
VRCLDVWETWLPWRKRSKRRLEPQAQQALSEPGIRWPTWWALLRRDLHLAGPDEAWDRQLWSAARSPKRRQNQKLKEQAPLPHGHFMHWGSSSILLAFALWPGRGGEGGASRWGFLRLLGALTTLGASGWTWTCFLLLPLYGVGPAPRRRSCPSSARVAGTRKGDVFIGYN